MNCYVSSLTKHAARVAAAVACALAVPVFLFAQQGTYQSRRTPPVTRDMRYREWILKDLEKKNSKLTVTDQQLAWAQIKEDYRQLQVVNNNMKRTVAANSSLDYKIISEATAEIRKRAGRLKSNLSFPKAEQGQQNRGDGLQMRTMLSALDGLIIRFIKNPFFKDTEVVDAEHSAQAGHDLERIIEFSSKLNRSADELNKK